MRGENAVFGMLNKLTDLFVLNLLFVICSLPVFTIGASLSALYAVSLRSVRYGDGYVVKTFFTAFKKSFKQATVVWLVTLLFGLLFFYDYRFWTVYETAMSKPMLTVSFIILIFVLMTLQWLFPLIAKTTDTLPRLLKNAISMAIGYFIPYTFACVAVVAGAFILSLKSAGMFFIMILIGFALISYLQSFFIYKVFAKHMTEEPAGDDDVLYANRDGE